MATYNVTLNRKGAGGWDQLYPVTTVDQITDASTPAKNLLKAAAPGADRFIKVTSSGTISFIDAATLKGATELNAADKNHGHETDDITDANSDTLTTVLAGKADLSNGKILTSQIPTYLFGGLKYSNSISANSALENLVSSLTGSTDEERKGSYLIASSNLTLSTAAGHTVEAPGDEDDNVLPIDIEAGDWVIYLGSNNWAIKNNTYPDATTTTKGVVKLSAGTATSRSQLSDLTTNRGLRVMDEAAVKKVVRDIFYSSTTPSGATGDIWFQGTF